VSLNFGMGVAYSPLLYREAAQKHDRFSAAFAAADKLIEQARLDTIVLLIADRERYFDQSNTPQFHIFAGDEIWGDSARLACDSETADLLLEELVWSGFDVAESRGAFAPAGDPVRGAVGALVEAALRFARNVNIVPIHINCHAVPAASGHRSHAFGAALAQAAALSEKRIGIIASGGLSGDPGGYLSGWVDPTLDAWILRRFATGRSKNAVGIFDVESTSLVGNAAEIRLWLCVAAAMETLGARADVIDYVEFKDAGIGAGIAVWDPNACR
jgi:hypothetical protein